MANDPKKDYIKSLLNATQGVINPIQELAGHAINATGDYLKNDWQRTMNSPSAGIAIPARIINNPGQFADNALRGAGDLVKGTVAIPGNVIRSVQQGTEGQDLVNLKNGVVNQYSNIAKDPYGQFIKDPVGTSLAIAPVGGVLGKAGKVGEVEEAAGAARAAGKVPKGWQSEGMKAQGLPPIGEKAALGQKMGFVNKTAEELAAGKVKSVPQNVVDTFLNQFDVPSKRMYRMDGQRVAQTILSDGIPTNFNSLKNYANTLTGGNGELPKMIYRALGDSKAPVDMSKILEAGQQRIGDIPSLGDSGGQLGKYQAEMGKMFPAQAGRITDPLTAWETMQELEDYGHSYLQKSTYLTDNPHAERLGRAYIDTAKEIQDALDTQLKNVDMNQYVTPEMRQKLGALSPQVLKRFDETPKTIQNLRSFQKPAVDVSNMVRQTEATAQSVWTKNAKAISGAMGGGVGGAIGMAGGPVGAGAGAFVGNAVLGPVLQPLAEAVLKRYLPDINIAGAKMMSKLQQGGLPALPGVSGLSGKLAPLGVAAMNTKGAAPQIPGGTMQQQSTGAGSAITPFYPDAQPDQAGHYQLPTQSTASTTFMTEQQREQMEAGLTPGTPEYQKIEQKFKQDQDMAKAQYTPQVAGFMKQAPAIVANSNKLYDDMTSFPMGIINNFDSLTKAAKYVDPKYQSFVTALDGLNSGFANLYGATMGQKPTDNMLISPKDSNQQAQVKIAYMNNFFAGTYGNYKDAYAATTSPAGTLTKTGMPVAAPAVSAPPQSDFSQMTQTQNLPQISLPPIGSLGQ